MCANDVLYNYICICNHYVKLLLMVWQVMCDQYPIAVDAGGVYER